MDFCGIEVCIDHPDAYERTSAAYVNVRHPIESERHIVAHWPKLGLLNSGTLYVTACSACSHGAAARKW